MRKMNTTKGTWEVTGFNLVPSDSLYTKIKECIEKGQLDEAYLQKVTGHRSPITVDHKRKRISFL